MIVLKACDMGTIQISRRFLYGPTLGVWSCLLIGSLFLLAGLEDCNAFHFHDTSVLPDDNTKEAPRTNNNIHLQPWQDCNVFMAPTNTTRGWGAFAARDFGEHELVDAIPMHLSMRSTSDAPIPERRLTKSTALDDYVYGFYRSHINKFETLLMYGYEMVYNHHPANPNVKLGFNGGSSPGFYTREKVQAGQELFACYVSRDRGENWFKSRNLTMQYDMPPVQSKEQLQYLSEQYCTKIHAGPGPETYKTLVPSIDKSRVAPVDAGLYDARAKVPIQAGERIEIGPALLLYKPFLNDTILAPLAITWESMRTEHKDAMRTAGAEVGGKLPIHYIGVASDMKRVMRMTKLENVAIFPFAGRIGTVRRVDTSSSSSLLPSNCRLDIHMDVTPASRNADSPEVSVVLEVVATKDISIHEVLMMDLKPGGTPTEREILKRNLGQTGYFYHLD